MKKPFTAKRLKYEQRRRQQRTILERKVSPQIDRIVQAELDRNDGIKRERKP
jgi:hypothetical protein